MSKFAVIDLGTNTFHLLIVKQKGRASFEEVYRKRIYVQLAEKGIANIGEAAFERAFQAIHKFHTCLKNNQVQSVKAFGTAALRTASNGRLFINKIREQFDLNIRLIDGMEEARLIHLGTKQAIPFTADYQLIMDVGGGSVEFIIANDYEVKWSRSFPIGVGVLFRRYHNSDPISKAEILTLEHFLEKQLAPLVKEIRNYDVQILTGASGAFDTLINLLENTRISDHHHVLGLNNFKDLYARITNSTYQERLQIEEIESGRKEMIVVAFILINFLVDKMTIKQVNVSNFALKEGMLWEMMK